MADFKYEITKEIGVLSETPSGWRKELNLVSWNGGEPKFDLRDWAPEHEKWARVLPCQKKNQRNLSLCSRKNYKCIAFNPHVIK